MRARALENSNTFRKLYLRIPVKKEGKSRENAEEERRGCQRTKMTHFMGKITTYQGGGTLDTSISPSLPKPLTFLCAPRVRLHWFTPQVARCLFQHPFFSAAAKRSCYSASYVTSEMMKLRMPTCFCLVTSSFCCGTRISSLKYHSKKQTNVVLSRSIDRKKHFPWRDATWRDVPWQVKENRPVYSESRGSMWSPLALRLFDNSEGLFQPITERTNHAHTSD